MVKSNMTNELAKELKDAGFPFSESYITNSNDFVYPSLSELIEGCGSSLIQIRQYSPNEWNVLAGSWHEGKITHFCDVTSSTLEEAVAKLWLALNKK